MAASTQSQRSAQQQGLERFRSLLVPVEEVSSGANRVAARAALLPLAEGARLTLLHVIPKRLSLEARKLAEKDAIAALNAEAERLTRTLPEGVVVRLVVTVGVPATEIVKQAKSAKAELIVMGRGGRSLRDVFLGSTAERVIRQAQLPVLVVRLPARTPYERPALAVDLDQAAQGAVSWLLRVLPPPRPRIALIHAYDAPLHGHVYPSLAADESDAYRDHYRDKAIHEIGRFLIKALANVQGSAQTSAQVSSKDAPSWKHHIKYGSPRTVIEKIVKKTHIDLLVLGTHGYSGVAHAFLGTVAGDVLREVPCDVLVVPPR